MLITEWKEFRLPSWAVIKKTTNQQIVLDGRNIYDKKEMEDIYFSILTRTKENAENMEAQINYSDNLAETAMKELKDSLNQILVFAEVEEDRKEEMKQIILEFKELMSQTAVYNF